MFSIQGVYFERATRSILTNIQLTVKKGEMLGLVGPSGAGKSTLLHILAGLLDASKGTVKLDGELILGPKDRLVPGHPEVQLVNQEFGLDLYHTVRENLIVKANHLTKEIRDQFADELLDLLGLTSIANSQAVYISGGEKQRLALGRALIMEPKVILLDEPFAHMDAHIKRKVVHYLQALKKTRKTSFIFVTHDGQDVIGLADKIAYFSEGKIQRLDIPRLFYEQPSSYQEALFFGEVNRLKIDKKEVLFRPHQYSLNALTGTNKIHVNFQFSTYYGGFVQSTFKVNKKEIIVLNHSESLNNVQEIYI
jgi:iron(III) transport system ATP-binding protein